ncbi:MAG: DUF4255 domain-containing protein [Flavobacteriaceae bacterium]
MILKTIQFTSTILNQFVKNRFHLDDTRVVLNDVIDENGTVPQLNQNKLVLTLINVEKETLKPFHVRNKKLEDGNFSKIAPVQRYNLALMISSHFDDYAESVKFLNSALLFFQTYPSIDASVYSSLPEGIKKLDYEMETISYPEMFNLWSAMGAKYRPSLIYKIRLLTLDPSEITGFETAISKVSEQVAV